MPSYVNLTNAGPGTLILNGANSFSGTLFMDTGSQTANDGMVVIANPNAISSIPAYCGPAVYYLPQRERRQFHARVGRHIGQHHCRPGHQFERSQCYAVH